MANKNTGKILISLIIGAVVAYYAYDMYAKQQKQIIQQNQLIQVMKLRDEQLAKKSYDYFVPIKDLEIGETVTVMDIKKITVSQKHDGAISSQNNIIGSVLVRPVKAQQVFTNEDFTSIAFEKSGLREGYRALTVSTESLDGMASEMKEGTLIDIFSKSKSDDKILSKIKILSLVPAKTETPVEKAANAVANEPVVKKEAISINQAKAVTFEIPINRVQDFVEIYSSGKIMLVMRPVGDDTVIKPKKEEKTKTSSSSAQNVNYNSSKLPSLPVVQTYEDPSINELPAPIKSGGYSNSVEIIEANSKTQISF